MRNLYRFVEIAEVEQTGRELLFLAREAKLKGTLLIAPEGYNVAVWGTLPELDRFFDGMKGLLPVEDEQVRSSPLSASPFMRLRLKIKSEIITFGKPARPQENEGTFIEPDELERFLAQPDVVLLDTRNHYEAVMGTFRGAHTLPISSFTELASRAPALAEQFRGKRVVTFCTGGVRCEKAVPYLRDQGLQAYQIRGGILAYLEKYPEGLWEGECFVFDDRFSIRPDGSKGTFSPCPHCGQPSRDGRCLVCSD